MPTPDAIARLAALMEKATPGPLALHRYEHGGGRLLKEEPRTLVADFYHEGDREAIVALVNAWPAIRRALTEARWVAGWYSTPEAQERCANDGGIKEAVANISMALAALAAAVPEGTA